MVRMLSLSVVASVILVGASLAQAETFGDWLTDTNGPTTLYAASVNSTGNIFGQFCFLGEGACVWLIGLRAGCEKGERHSVLANSDAGTAHLEVLCEGQLKDGLYRYAFIDFEQIEALVKQGARVGFAVPLQEDQFRIVRFSLRGAEAALSVMRGVAEKRTTPATRDRREEQM